VASCARRIWGGGPGAGHSQSDQLPLMST
jgi:hypothetical protein